MFKFKKKKQNGKKKIIKSVKPSFTTFKILWKMEKENLYNIIVFFLNFLKVTTNLPIFIIYKYV